MDGSHPNIADPRPKRRKSKDNPYEIYTTGVDTPDAHYYVRFHDGQGVEHCLKIDKSLFELLDGFEKEDLHFLNEYDRHYEHLEQTEHSIYQRSVMTVEAVEDTVMRHLRCGDLHNAILKLPEKQRHRLILHYFGDMQIKEIAEIEGRNQSVISRSITTAERKLKKLLGE